MAWIGFGVFIAVFVLLPLGLLCYSAIATAIEVGRKGQPFLDSFFDVIAMISGYSRPRRPQVEKPSSDSQPDPR